MCLVALHFICILFVFIYHHQFVVMPYVCACFVLLHLFVACELFIGFSMFATSLLTSSFVVLHQICLFFCINAFLKTTLFLFCNNVSLYHYKQPIHLWCLFKRFFHICRGPFHRLGKALSILYISPPYLEFFCLEC
jgi:hypothetical protein